MEKSSLCKYFENMNIDFSNRNSFNDSNEFVVPSNMTFHEMSIQPPPPVQRKHSEKITGKIIIGKKKIKIQEKSRLLFIRRWRSSRISIQWLNGGSGTTDTSRFCSSISK